MQGRRRALCKRRPRHERDPGFGCPDSGGDRQQLGWFLAFGIALVLLGALAIVRSVAATVVSMLFFGWLLLFAAGIEVVQAIMVGKWAGLFQHWLSAALFGVLGALIIWRPVVTAEILT